MIKKLFVLLIISAILIIPVSAEEFETVDKVKELKLAKDITTNDINQTVIAEKMHKAEYNEKGELLRGAHGEVTGETLKQMLLDKTITNTEYDRMAVLIYDKEQKNELIIDETDRKKIIPDETVPDETIPDETISDETIPDETIPDETILDETIPDETIPDETIPDEIISEKLEETSPTKEELYQEHNELLIENDVKEQSFIVGLIEFLKNLIN